MQGARCLVLVAICVLGVGTGLAEQKTIAVYPIKSQDVMLGMAIADRIAEGLAPQAQVFGPAETPALIPPLEVRGGFVTPIELLGPEAALGDITDRVGTQVLREALGVDVAVAGSVSIGAESMTLRLYLADEERVRLILVGAEEAPDASTAGELVRKALDVLSARLDLAVDRSDVAIDLSAPYGDYVAALALLSGGFLSEALLRLEQALEAEARPKWRQLYEDVDKVMSGEQVLGANPVLQAATSLSTLPFDEAHSAFFFGALDLPFAHLWLATLEGNRGQLQEALGAFERARKYPYGKAASALFLALRDMPGALTAARSALDSDDRSALLAASLAAQALAETDLEKELLTRLSRLAPSLAYPFERLSFIAFDEDDPRTAAQALSVAVELEPTSDLYWINLGWAYYLLGLLERSEQASVRGTELNPSQEIAWYNLGLVKAATGRLAEAMTAYRRALDIDGDVHPEAVTDLEDALERFPHESGLHFALATLYDAQRERAAAARHFELYLKRDEERLFAREAQSRLDVLIAPPAPLLLGDAVAVGLGPNGVQAEPYRPGERLYLRFELYTPGHELPHMAMIHVELLKEGQRVAILEEGRRVRIPPDVVALVVDDVGFDLPDELKAGQYELAIEVVADDDQRASAQAAVRIEGQSQLVRRLIGRSVVLRELDTGAPFYRARDAASLEDDAIIVRLVDELRAAAHAAQTALPRISEGRFAGLTGGQLFSTSQSADVRDFLVYLLDEARPGADFTFVDAYAQWALDGGRPY